MILATAVICLALNVYFEARSDNIPGQYAVALVTKNRASGDPDKVCTEVVKPRQFSWTNGKVRFVRGVYHLRTKAIPKERESWGLAMLIAKRVLENKIGDFTMGATHYHTPAVNPVWNKSMFAARRIGQHIFYRQA